MFIKAQAVAADAHLDLHCGVVCVFVLQVNGTEADYEYEEITLERVSGTFQAGVAFCRIGNRNHNQE